MTIKLVVVEDYEALSRRAAEHLMSLVRAKPDANVVLATGNSPIGMYRELALRRRRGELDASRLRVFQLDAYFGLSSDDPRSLYSWMDREFLGPLGIPSGHVVRLPGDAADPASACHAYVEAVGAAGGFDLAVLGLGPNGHLGFNEPPSDSQAPTRLVDLTEESIVSNAAYWGGRDRVPRQALTAGLDLLLAARDVLLLVSGAHKQAILRRALTGPVTPEVPASYLQQVDALVIADRAAWPGPIPEPR